MSPFWQLFLSRLRTFVREPSAVFWVYAFPLVMVFSLGTAFRNDQTDQITIDVQDGAVSNELVEQLNESGRFRVHVSDADAAARRLRTGKTELVVSAKSTAADVSYTFDPTRPGSRIARNAVDDLLQRAAGRVDVVTSSDVEVNQPGSRYIDFLVPGLIGMGLMGGGMWGVGFATVDLRIRKLLKRFVATPMKRTHFLGAMITSRLVFTIPPGLGRFIAPKGSVTLDGVSLTVNEVSNDRFGVNIISHTQDVTTLGDAQPGALTNLEVDVIARYLARQMDRS